MHPPPPPLMTLMLLAGIGSALVATVLMVSVWRLPARPRCPECGTSTHAVVAPRWVRLMRLRIDTRWCMECGWEGFARRDAAARLDGAVRHVWGLPRARDNSEGGDRPDGARRGYRVKPPRMRRPGQPEAPPEEGYFRWKDEGEN